jgi:glutathione S-transferase
MITLFQYPTYWGMPNVSPFCMKLETYLRLANIPYTVKYTKNPGRAPRGKLPFIKDGDTILADSGIIIGYLKKQYGNPLDQDLQPLQIAQGIAIQRMLEEHLYFTVVFSRWVDPDFYPEFGATIFAKLPAVIKILVPPLLRRKVKKQLYEQGTGRYTAPEIYAAGTEDINALAQLLGDDLFLFGDKPSSFDAILFALLASILMPPLATPLKLAVSQQPALVAYVQRILQLAYPQLDPKL